MWHTIPAVFFFALVVLFFWALEAPPESDRTTPDAVIALQEAPPLDVTALGGETSLPLAMTGNKPVLLNFFASWCTPCVAEHPLMRQLGARDDLFLYGVGWSDKAKTLRAWLDKNGNPYDHVALDNQGRSGIAYGITGVPESFLLDAERRILYHQRGPLTPEIIEKDILPRLEAQHETR